MCCKSKVVTVSYSEKVKEAGRHQHEPSQASNLQNHGKVHLHRDSTNIQSHFSCQINLPLLFALKQLRRVESLTADPSRELTLLLACVSPRRRRWELCARFGSDSRSRHAVLIPTLWRKSAVTGTGARNDGGVRTADWDVAEQLLKGGKESAALLRADFRERRGPESLSFLLFLITTHLKWINGTLNGVTDGI